MNVLVLDAGSSSLKFRVIEVDDGEARTLLDGHIDKIGSPGATLHVTDGSQPIDRSVTAPTAVKAAHVAIDSLTNGSFPPIQAVGHRVVHGGATFTSATVVTPSIVNAIRKLGPLAPLHNPVAADVIEIALKRFPNVPNVAVFDTAFHSTLPEIAWRYALPRDVADQLGLRRYGFHGISHQVVSRQLLERMGRGAAGTRVITCHLGNGASVCAIRDGVSIDTSMGMTPLEGLVMGTRSGDVDPGLLVYLLSLKDWDSKRLDTLLNEKSGLLGLSGTSSDVRDLEKSAAGGDARAGVALDVFAYRVRKYIGAYAAALGGLDAIAFTAGIGERSARMRQRICADLEFLGIDLSVERNTAANGDAEVEINETDSPVALWVIPTDEEGEIARQTAAALVRV